MIARLSHNHIPRKVIQNPLFDSYCLSENAVYTQTKKEWFVNIDEMQPQYTTKDMVHSQKSNQKSGSPTKTSGLDL